MGYKGLVQNTLIKHSPTQAPCKNDIKGQNALLMLWPLCGTENFLFKNIFPSGSILEYPDDILNNKVTVNTYLYSLRLPSMLLTRREGSRASRLIQLLHDMQLIPYPGVATNLNQRKLHNKP